MDYSNKLTELMLREKELQTALQKIYEDRAALRAEREEVRKALERLDTQL